MMKMELNSIVISCFILLSFTCSYSYCLTNSPIFTLDDFSGNQLIIGVITDNSIFPIIHNDFYTTTAVIGGERDLELVVTSGPSGAVYTAGVNNDDLSNSSPYQGSAFTIYQLDGIDASSEINENGLNHFDLTFEGRANALLLIGFFSDVDTIIEFYVYTSTGIGVYTLNVPGGKKLSDNQFVIEYNNFSGNANFSDVGAIEVKFYGDEDVDVQFNFFGVVSSV